MVGALLPLLRSDEAPVRNVAMDILREIGVDSIESMQPYLMDEDPDLRIFITDILGYCRTHQASLLLGRALLKDPEVTVRYQAAVSSAIWLFPKPWACWCRPCTTRNGYSLPWWRSGQNPRPLRRQRARQTAAPGFAPGQFDHLWTPLGRWATSSPFPCCSAR